MRGVCCATRWNTQRQRQRQRRRSSVVFGQERIGYRGYGMMLGKSACRQAPTWIVKAWSMPFKGTTRFTATMCCPTALILYIWARGRWFGIQLPFSSEIWHVAGGPAPSLLYDYYNPNPQ